LAGKPCLLIAVSASGSGFNAFQLLHHLQEFALMLSMQPINITKWPYIGISAKSGDIYKDAILKETETIKQTKKALELLINKMKDRGKR
jgi:serine phosphatase RsbU (regulator of sigma subunit)